MVSRAFFTGSKYLVEDDDGRHEYLRHDGDRFLTGLAAPGRKVLGAPFTAEQEQSAYLESLVSINAAYFDAREFEESVQGSFYRHDPDSERDLRRTVADGLSDAVADLRALLDAHDDLLDVAVEEIAAESPVGDDANDRRAAVQRTLLACTDRAVEDGWLPVIESYYHALSPGELVAEGRERRDQRIHGTESSTGIADLLDRPHASRLTDADLRRVRKLNRAAPGEDARVWKQVREDYPWLVSNERSETA